MVTGLPEPLAVAPPGEALTVYQPTDVPQSRSVGVKETLACPSPATAETPARLFESRLAALTRVRDLASSARQLRASEHLAGAGWSGSQRHRFGSAVPIWLNHGTLAAFPKLRVVGS